MCGPCKKKQNARCAWDEQGNFRRHNAHCGLLAALWRGCADTMATSADLIDVTLKTRLSAEIADSKLVTQAYCMDCGAVKFKTPCDIWYMWLTGGRPEGQEIPTSISAMLLMDNGSVAYPSEEQALCILGYMHTLNTGVRGEPMQQRPTGQQTAASANSPINNDDDDLDFPEDDD